MKKLELYDILTLTDNQEYMVIETRKLNNKDYYLISKIDKKETPILNEIKIVEIKEDELITIEDKELLTKLTELFASDLEKDAHQK